MARMPKTTGTSASAAWSRHLVWNYWIDTHVSSSAISTWNAWSTITSNSAGTNLIWTEWNTGTAAVGNGIVLTDINYHDNSTAAKPLTDTEREAVRQRAREQEREHARRWCKERAARLRAEQLLAEVLTREQAHDLEAQGAFHVYTQEGRKYRINRGSHGNVQWVDEAGVVKKTYCAPVAAHLPDADHMLSQMLLLQADEPAFLKVANAR